MSTERDLEHLVRSAYTNAGVTARYERRGKGGLRVWEQRVAPEFFPDRATTLCIGCGAGREAFGLENLGFTVCGIDASIPLVTGAAKNRHAFGSEVNFAVADGRALPFGDHAFDVVTLWSQTCRLLRVEKRCSARLRASSDRAAS